jgi:hypothetical protein
MTAPRKSQTTAARLARIEAALEQLLTPAQAAPAKAQAKAPNTFYTDVIVARATSRKPCAIAAHGKSCNRTFSSGSTGDVNHTARID